MLGYELVEDEKVLEELNSGAELIVIHIPTRRVIECKDLTLSAIRSFISCYGTAFLKAVEIKDNE